MNEYLIKALKDGRSKKGMKQSEVADLLGVKGGTLSNYENGISEPDIDTFAMLCEIYELDFAYVLGEAYGLGIQGESFKIRPSEIDHVKKYRDLDPHGREMVDIVLQKEYERCKPLKSATIPFLHIVDEPELNAAHERPDASFEDQEADNAMMDDEKF